MNTHDNVKNLKETYEKTTIGMIENSRESIGKNFREGRNKNISEVNKVLSYHEMI